MARVDFDFAWYRRHLLEGLKSNRIEGRISKDGLQYRKTRGRGHVIFTIDMATPSYL